MSDLVKDLRIAASALVQDTPEFAVDETLFAHAADAIEALQQQVEKAEAADTQLRAEFFLLRMSAQKKDERIEALQLQVAELECAVRLAVSDLTIDKSFAEQLIHEAREKCNG